jgi:hypothetical protein
MAEVKFMPIPANIHLHHESLDTGVDLSHQATCPEHATLKTFGQGGKCIGYRNPPRGFLEKCAKLLAKKSGCS